MLSHLLLKRVNALVNTIETPIHSIQALVDPIQTLVDSVNALVDQIQPPVDPIQPGFDVRQTPAYLRKLRCKPGLERSTDGAHRNFLSLLDAFDCHDFSSIHAIPCSR